MDLAAEPLQAGVVAQCPRPPGLKTVVFISESRV